VLLKLPAAESDDEVTSALIHSLMEGCVWPVHRQLAKDLLRSKNTEQQTDGLQRLLLPLRQLPSLLPIAQAQAYFPPLLELALRLAKHAACTCPGTLQAALDNLRAVVAAVKSAGIDLKQKTLMFAGSVATSLDSINDSFEDSKTTGPDVVLLFELWISIAAAVPYAVVQSGSPLFHRAVALWQQGLLSPQSSIRAHVAIALRKYLQGGMADQERSGTTRAFLGALGPRILLAVKLEEKSPSPQRVDICTEGTKILLLAFSLANPDHQTALIAVMLPVLLSLLAADASLKQLACQSLLHIAQRASVAFKQNLVALPADQRQLLETSLRAALSSRAPTSASSQTISAKQPMKLNLSHYNK
jgi:hypothetical protein